MAVPIPKNEEERLRALDRYKVLDTPPEGAFDKITRLAATLLGTPIALISLVDRDRQWFKSRQGHDAEQTPRDMAFCAHAICGEDVFVVPDATQDARFSANPLVTADPNIRFYAGAPLRTPDGHNLGTLCVIDRVPRELSEAHRNLLAQLASMVINEFEIRSAGKHAVEELLEKDRQAVELYRLAMTDPLTGALNQRALHETAQAELLRAKRYHRDLSVLLLDIDNFKRINDEFGHAAGDAVLKALVERVRAQLRVEDIVGRIGGDEFVLLIPETSLGGARILGTRIKDELACRSIEIENASLRFTVSIGIAQCTPATECFKDALRRADTALYVAKQSGRNQVQCRSAVYVRL